ncbi:MAG: hypothetical protein FWH27_06560 [Planctomycetaceae bacterium]|nr:hypothetical protein [Planctomycetaceae bacterium]
MDELLICTDLFREATPEDLKAAINVPDVGILTEAVKIPPLPSKELDGILQRNWCSLPPHSVGIPGFNLSPFAQKVEMDDGVIEYYCSNVRVYSLTAACKLWGAGEVARALTRYEEWLHSSDAKRDDPSNRPCFLLRRCVTEAEKLFAILNYQQAGQNQEKGNPAPTPSKQLSRHFMKRSDKLLAMDAAVQIILEAMFANAPFPVLTEVAEQLFKDGFAINPETFNKRLSANKVIKALRSQSKKRPETTSGKAYEKWREGLMKTLVSFRVPILQSDDAGLEEPAKTGRAKKKEENENSDMTKS